MAVLQVPARKRASCTSSTRNDSTSLVAGNDSTSCDSRSCPSAGLGDSAPPPPPRHPATAAPASGHHRSSIASASWRPLTLDARLEADPRCGHLDARLETDSDCLRLPPADCRPDRARPNLHCPVTAPAWLPSSSQDPMTMSRAAWNYNYEKGLVHVMRDHVNIPMFRGQNGWTVEGWRSILEKFNQQFPSAHFTKGQLQEKEKELKGSWKAIRDARKESGVGWNDLLSMIIAEPEKWKKLVNDNAKLARFQKKPFPLYDDCTSLYAGSVATGELNFTSTGHLAPAAQLPAAAPQPPPAPLPPAAALSERSARSASFTSLDGPDITSAHNEAQSAHSNQDFVEGASGRRKCKQSHIGSAIEDYVQYKKKQTGKTIEALEERKKKEEAFSVPKCLDEMDAMDGLTDVEKSYGMDIFKSEIDRECSWWRQCLN